MAQEDSAPGAPRGSFAHAATGFRRLTPGLLKADRTAEGFTGLPEGVKSPGQLLAALKAAAPRLGIPPRLVHAVDWLFRFTQPQDWERGSRPVVWPSASMQQEALGLSPTQVKEINRRLIELGLVTMKDSPNGKRYGRRHEKTGRIIEAYGFDLSPIAMRHGEFVRLAEEGRAERLAMGRLRRRVTIARKAIAQILETAAEYAIEGEEWIVLARETQYLTRALRGVERVDEMETGVRSLERRQIAARERLENLLGLVDSNPKEPENRPHQYNYKPNPNPKKDTVIAAKDCSQEREEAGAQSPAQQQRQPTEEGHGARHPARRAAAADAQAQALSAASQSDLAGDHRRRRLAAARPRGVETLMGRGLSRHGPRTGGGRAGDRLDQGGGAFPDHARRLLPRHGRPKPKPANYTSNARYGLCDAPRNREITGPGMRKGLEPPRE